MTQDPALTPELIAAHGLNDEEYQRILSETEVD